MNQAVSVFWFRRDLRLHDNHGLFRALTGDWPVLAIFIFDKNILDSLPEKEDARVSFIHSALSNVERKLQETGSSLLAIHDNPLAAFEKVCSLFNVKEVFTNHDYEPYAIRRDEQISRLLQSKKISFHSFKDQVIYDRSEVVKGDQTPYTIFTPYAKAWKRKFSEQPTNQYTSEGLIHRFVKAKPFPFPSLPKIGFEPSKVHIPSARVDRRIISTYDKTRDIPSMNGTTRLSVHLRFGTVSIRSLAETARQLNEQWLNELIWREFFMMILFHFPEVVTHSFKRKYDNISWRNDEREFALWCKGETGYPIVDAGMRELNETGFMHNRVRMVVASFLTKHLLIDWRWGEAYFANKLLDYELSSNNGNWQWAAGCGCDAAPYFRIFNPAEQTKRFDPQLLYIKKWIRNFDSYHIRPIVEHDFARKRALAAYRDALHQ